MDHDVIVIGGGLVGVSIAWGLSRYRQSVALVDEGDVAPRAARANFGLVWSSSKGLGSAAYSRLSRASSAGWHQLASELQAETGIDTGFVESGGFSLRLTPMELDRGIASMAKLASQPGMEAGGVPPLRYEVLDQAETRRRLPLVGDTVAGAIFSPLDGHANPLRVFAAFHKAFQQRGGRYLPHRKTTAIRHLEDGGFAVAGEGWTLRAGKVVLAAGIGNTALAPMVGLEVPLKPSRGQIIVTERLQPFLHHATGLQRRQRRRRAARSRPRHHPPYRGLGRLAWPILHDGRVLRMLVTIDGRPNRQACLVPVAEGMRVETQDGAARPGGEE